MDRSTDRLLARPESYMIAIMSDPSMGAVKIITPDSATSVTIEKEKVFGPTAPTERCSKCGQGINSCPGHAGAIAVYPIPAPLAHQRLVKWLGIICSVCGRVAISDKEKERRAARQNLDFESIRNHLRVLGRDSKCPFCSEPLSVFHPVRFALQGGWDHSNSPLFHIAPAQDYDLTGDYHTLRIADNSYIKRLLEGSDVEDIRLFGFSIYRYHPSHLIWSFIPISPPAARPVPSAATRSGSSRIHKLYQAVITTQAEISEILSGRTLVQVKTQFTNAKYDDLVSKIFMLYFLVVTIQNRLPDHLASIVAKQFKLGSQQEGLSFTNLLRHKSGVPRRLLSGARHDVNARTPLAGNPFGVTGTVTFPIAFAMKIGVDRTVTVENIELMRILVRNGPSAYPGANAYKRGGTTYTIYDKDREEIASSLVPGDIVVRHLVTGDIGFHHRNPAIREESINCVMLIVDPGQLIRAPTGGCVRMMADFDGDDTEVFIPSSFGIAAESFLLQSAIRQFLAPLNGKPCIGMGAGGDSGTDAIAGLKMLKLVGAFTQAQVNAIYSRMHTDAPTPSGKETYTYDDIMAPILPPDLYFDGDLSGEAAGVVIEGGKMMKGQVTYAGFDILSSTNSYLSMQVARTIEPYTALQLLEDATRIGYMAALTLGWSTSDCVRYSSEQKEELDRLIEERVTAIDELCNRFHDGKLSIPFGAEPLEYFESKLINQVASINAIPILELAKKMFKGTNYDTHGFFDEFKGHIVPIVMTRGQILSQNHRFRPIIDHNSRFLVWFPKGRDNAIAGGYARHGYARGLTPPEFFNEAALGREELFAKGVGLSKQGYMTRKLAASIGIIHLDYFGFPRGHNDTILSFYYGTMNCDPHYSIPVMIDDHLVDSDEFKKRHGAVKAEFDALSVIRDAWREAIVDYSNVTSDDGFTPTRKRFLSPLDLNAIIAMYTPAIGSLWKRLSPSVSTASKEGSKEKKLTRAEMWEMLAVIPFSNAHIGKRAGPFVKKIVKHRVAAFLRIFRFICSTDRLMRDRPGGELRSESRWTKTDLERLIGSVMAQYALTLAAHGEPVGMKATYNISAPLIQGMLHSTRGGGGQKGEVSTLEREHGIDLYLEKLEGGKNPKRPVTEFSLTDLYNDDYQSCINYVKALSSVKLIDVMINAWLVSIAPEEIDNASDCGMSVLREYLKSMPPTLRKEYERSRKTWFYVVVHLEPLHLMISHVDMAMIGIRLQKQFPAFIDVASSVYANKDGLFLFLSINAGDFSRTDKIDPMSMLRHRFETIIDTGIIHGHPSFSNGMVIEYNGRPIIRSDGSMTSKKTYRIAVNGSDFHYLLNDPLVEKRTLINSAMFPTEETYGIEELQFRTYEDLAYESSQMNALKDMLVRHLKVVSDFITYRGRISSIVRFSLGANPDVDPLDKMVFETADEFLKDALATNQWRPIRGITPCSLFGLPLPFGTTMSSILLRTTDIEPTSSDSSLDPLVPAPLERGVGKKGKERVVPTPIDEAVSR